ncbi:MAG: DsrE family protein [Terriglobia bacterium]
MKHTFVLYALVVAGCLLLSTAVGTAQDYAALKGVEKVKVAFDVRTGVPQTAARQLKLIHDTHKQLIALKKSPVSAVVFIGPAVKLISTNREGFKPEELPLLDEIAQTVSAIANDGIPLEVCLFAAKVFNVDPATVLPEITRVENGYVSLIGYETQGYSLIPVY